MDPVWGRQREELLTEICRLARIVLDRIDHGTREGTLDQGQMRMLGSIALRSLGLWKEALNGESSGRSVLRGLLEQERKLTASREDGDRA